MYLSDLIIADCEESVRRKILWENGRDLYKIEEPSADDEAKLLAACSESGSRLMRSACSTRSRPP